MKRVAVIGAGIFGISIALELSNHFKVTLFEKNGTILNGASHGNQNRFHYGYHYPRSIATGRECLTSLESFKKTYGAALLNDLQNYYCIAKHGSKTSAADYLTFCRSLSLPYEKSWPPAEFLAREKISLSLRVPEPIFDFIRLREIALQKLTSSARIELKLNSRIVDGAIGQDNRKRLVMERNGESSTREFDYVINATYNHVNDFCEWMGLRQKKFQFELVELPVIELHDGTRIGVTIMDGDFCSILPFGRSDYSLLYHASKSVLETAISTKYQMKDCFDSRCEEIMKSAAEFIPIVGNSICKNSIIAVRVVDPDSEVDDARRSIIIPHGSGCWSIFSGKIVTACAIGKELANRILGVEDAPLR